MTVESRVQVPFVDLRAQIDSIRGDLTTAIDRVVDQGDFILGESVESFEREMASYCDVGFAVGVDSGTSGLELALLAYDIGPGDEVITVANTFIATVLAISATGATPILVDMDEETYGMDVEQLERVIGPDTKAIIPVHLYGHPVDMGPVLTLAKEHNLRVIEDASQAHGARYEGARVGSLGDAAVFSLYPAKNLGAFGDAGIVVTDDADVAERLRLLRNYGSPQKYVHEVRGFNRRLDTIQAAVLRVKLPHLDDWNAKRRELANRYCEKLSELGDRVKVPHTAPYAEPVYHLFVIRVPERDDLARHLADEGVSTQVHYPIPVHLQAAYAGLGHTEGSFPLSERAAKEILSLPIYPELDIDQVDRIVEATGRILEETED